jgi:transposase
VCAFVHRTFAVDYTAHAMAKLLKRLGFVYKRPKGVPAKADAAAQRRFVEETLAPLLAQASAEEPVYFTDAAHRGYTAHPGYGWIRKGETRELKSNHGRVRVNINGALSWPDRAVVHRTAEKITSAAMIALFEDLQARHPTASAIWVVLDNARYNHSAELRAWLAGEGCRIRPVYLPTYSPNLNLIERFWRLLKDAVLRNEYFPTYAAFRAAIEGFFAHLDDYRIQIESLITDRFHFIGKQNPQAP